MSFLLTLLLSNPTTSCPIPQILLNPPGITRLDLDTFKKAQKRCAALYPKSPCIKRFLRPEPLSYQVVCGAKVPY